MFRKPLNRRTLLRGAGALLALPAFEAMPPKRLLAAEAMTAPKRLAFIYIPVGAIMQHWTPEKDGSDYQLSKTLASLEPHRKELLVLTGLAHDKARANGDGAGDHARDSAAYLTAAQPRKTAGADIKVGVSVDQIAAQAVGNETRLPSLELGIEDGRQAGNCDSGYSCAYSSNISWRSETQPVAKEINPRAVFERLFGNGSDDAKAQERRQFYRQSILDFVGEDADRLRQQLGGKDRQKLDEYFTSVREVELRIERAASEAAARKPEIEAPKGVPGDFAEHVRLMYDLMALGFQTDSTRISTFMLANSGSNRTYSEIGVKGGHHEISHHRNQQDLMEGLQKIDQYMVEQFAYFLGKLKEIKEGEGTLLDNCMLVYGSATADPNRHQHDDLPVLLAGRGAGTIDTGRHLRVKDETPMANLFLSLLDRFGTPQEAFGDSTDRLKELG